MLLFFLLVFFIDPYQKGVYVFFIFAFYFITIEILSFVEALDKFGLLLLFFSISYSIIFSRQPDATVPLMLVYAICPITFYVLGKYFSIKYSSHKVFYFLFLFLSIGFSFIPAVSIIYHIIENGFVGERRLMLLTRDVLSGGPLLGSFFTINMAAIGTIFVQSSKKIENKIKIISLVVFIISLLCALRVASRTQLGIALISLFVTIAYLSVKQPIIKNIRLILAIAFILIVVLFSISSDSAILNTINQRNNSTEELLIANGRTELWLTSLSNIMTKPMGWNMSSDISIYAHNLWLDVSRVAGIAPFLFLLIFTVICIRLVLKTIKVSPQDLYFNTFIIVLFVGFMVEFSVEPVIEGMYNLFLIFCFFIGILSGYVKTGLVQKTDLKKYRYVKFEYNNENTNNII